MQSVVVVPLTQKAPVAAGAGQAPGGEGDAATTSGAGVFAALLAAQMLGAGDGSQMPVLVDTVGDTPVAGDAKPKDLAVDVSPDPALAGMVLVPPVMAPVDGAQQVSDAKAETTNAASDATVSSLQLAALQTDVKTGQAGTRGVPDGSPRLPSPSLSGVLQQNAAGGTGTIVVENGNPKTGLDKVAEFAVGGKVLPVAVETKSAESRVVAPLLPEAPRSPETSSAAMLQNMAQAQRVPSADTNSASSSLAPAVGSPGWGDALGQKVVWMAGQHQQVAELHLNPPNLGPMEVRLTVNGDQVTAAFVSHQPAVREAIEAAMPRLREMFADSGMTLGNAMVSSDSLPQHQSSGQEGRSSGSSPQLDFSLVPDNAPRGTVGGTLSLGVGGRGMVDLFA